MSKACQTYKWYNPNHLRRVGQLEIWNLTSNKGDLHTHSNVICQISGVFKNIFIKVWTRPHGKSCGFENTRVHVNRA